jgi:hypothetical protein
MQVVRNNMDAHTSLPRVRAFCGLMMSASSALTSHRATDDDRLRRLEESQRHLVAACSGSTAAPDWSFAETHHATETRQV